MTTTGKQDFKQPGNVSNSLMPENTVGQDQFQKAVLNASIVSMTDKHGTITFVNDNFVAISGYSRQELIGQNHRIINSGHHTKQFWVEMWKTISIGKTWRADVKNKAKNGTYYWVDTFVMPTQNADGAHEGFISIRNDITTRKQQEGEIVELNKSLADFQHAIQGSSIVSMTDKHGVIKYVNENFVAISGYTKDELIGQNHRIINSQFHAKSFWVNMWKTISSGKTWRGEVKNKTKHGTYYWVDTFVMPFLDHEGKIHEFLSIRNDITERKKIEEELASANERARETLVFAKIGTAELETTTGVLKVSKELAEILEYSVPTAHETTIHEFFKSFVNEADHETLYEVIASGRTTDENDKKRINVDFEIVTCNGKTKYIEAIGIFQHNNVAFGILQDVTWRRKIEHEREQAQIDAITKGRQIERILFSITDGFFALDRSLRFTLVNPVFSTLAGLTITEILGKHLLSLFPSLNNSPLIESYRVAMQTGESFSVEYENPLQAGQFFEINAYPNLEGIFIYYRDISEKKQVQKRLANEELVIKNLANNLPHAVIYQYTVNADGGGYFSFISQAIERVTGYSVNEVLNDPLILEVNVHPDDMEEHNKATMNAISNRSFYSSIYRLKCKDGLYRWIDARSVPRQVEGDKLVYDGTIVDITDHKKLQDALVEQRSLLQGFFNASSDINIMLDASCCYLSMNNVARENLVNVFGVSPAIGDSAMPFIKAFNISLYIEKALRGEPVIVDQEYSYPNGIRKWNNMRFIPVRNDRGELVSIVINSTDITERNLALLEVEKSRTELRAILNASVDSIFFLDKQFKIITLNETARKSFLQTIHREPAVGDNMLDFLGYVPELKVKFIDCFYTALGGETIQKESQMEIDGNTLWLQVGYFPVRNSFNNIIGVSLNLNDITARKMAEARLSKRDAQIRDTAMMANIGDWEVDLNNMQVYWSDEVCRIHEVELGYQPNVATAINYYSPECKPVIEDAVKKCIETGASFDLQLEIITAKENRRNIRTIGVCEFNEGKALKLYGLFQDITRQKQNESELKKLAYIAKNTNNAVVITDKHGFIEWVNKAFETVTGYTLDEVSGRKPGDFLQGKETDKAVNALVRDALKNQREIRFEVLNYNKWGVKYWVEIQIEPIFDEVGVLTHFMAIQVDITDKKQADQLLKAQANRLKQVNEQLINLSENIPKGVIYQILVTADQQRSFKFISAGIEKMTGLTADSLIKDSTGFILCIYHTDIQSLLTAEKTAIENMSVLKLEFRLRHTSGKVFWVQANATPRKVAEGVLFDGFILDITERKNAEHELFQSKKHLESLVGSQTNYLVRLDIQGYYTYVNDRFLKQFKLKADQLGGISFVHTLIPIDVELAARVMKTCYTEPGKVVPVTLRSKSDGEDFIWTEWEFVAIQDELGKVINIQAVGFDATERIRSQQQLEITSSRLSLATKAAHLGIGEWDLANNIFHSDDVLTHMLGLEYKKEISIEELKQLMHPADMDRILSDLELVVPSRPSWEGTFRMIRPSDKKLCIIRFYCTAVFNDDGKVEKLTGMNLDVTEQETAFAAVQESEKRFKALADSAPVLIWMADLKGHCIYFNKSWLKYTGSSFEEQIGEGWLNQIHSDDREDYYHMFLDHLQNKQEFLMEFRLRRNDGQYRWMLGHGTPRYLEDNLFVGFIGSCFDIHDRKEAEIKLIERNNEKDILIKEIHHRVKNNLQLISSIIFIRLNKMERGEIRTFLEETRQKIHSIALLHERLLQTEGLNKVDMDSYLSKLLHNLSQAIGLQDRNIEMRTEIEHQVFDIDVAIHCGLILNELISNALKHAFKNARNGFVYVGLRTVEEKKAELIVSDNGIGMPEGIVPGGNGSFGMQLLEVSIRQLKAKVTIDRSMGTTFRIVF